VRVEPIEGEEQAEAQDERSCRTAVTIGAVMPSGGRQAAANSGQTQTQAQGQAQGQIEPGSDD
jgi:hypothetical protein